MVQTSYDNAAQTIKNAFSSSLPTPPQEMAVYQAEVLNRLVADPALTQWLPQADGETFFLTAKIDVQGQLHDFDSESKVLANGLASAMTSLGTWQPGSIKDTAAPGELHIMLRFHYGNLQLSMQPRVVFPGTAGPNTSK